MVLSNNLRQGGKLNFEATLPLSQGCERSLAINQETMHWKKKRRRCGRPGIEVVAHLMTGIIAILQV
jgi:hypothetical protein